MAEGTETGTGTGTGTGTETPAWYAGADADTLGYLQNRGWDKVDARTAAFEAGKAHRAAEKLIGAPADQLIRIPKDATDAAGWTALRQKLGVPADAKGYDFSSVKDAKGTAVAEDLTTKLGDAFAKAGVTKDAAPSLLKALVDNNDQSALSNEAKTQETIATQKDALKANWGNNYNQNLLVAQNAAKALGVKPEAVAALEKAVGYDAVMEMFRNIGSRIGEDKFITPNLPGQNGVMTIEQTQSRLKECTNDQVWRDKLQKGDQDTLREFNALTTIISNAKRG